MAYSEDQAAKLVEERFKAIHRLIYEIEKERKRNEPTLDDITKTHDNITKTQERKISPYYQQKLKGLYTSALQDAEKEEKLIRRALENIHEIRNICHEQRIQAKCAGNKEISRRGDLVEMIQNLAQTLPLWIGKPGEKVPPLCGAVPAESTYIAKTGDMVAAIVKTAEGEETWMLAEVFRYNADIKQYEVDDIDEEQVGKARHTLIKRRVVPLPLMRANPETDPSALFPKGSVVMALFPQSTCFYPAVVHKLPATATDDYEMLFEDQQNATGYTPPVKVPQCYVIAVKNQKVSFFCPT